MSIKNPFGHILQAFSDCRYHPCVNGQPISILGEKIGGIYTNSYNLSKKQKTNFLQRNVYAIFSLQVLSL
jgi:hypothetical protein